MSDPIFLSRSALGMVGPRSISRNIDPSRGGMMAHWGGGAQRVTTLDAAVGRWLAWQRMHMIDKGWVDIAYNFGFWRQYVFAGRGVRVRSAANGTNDANGRYVAAVWIGGQGETPAAVDVATFAWLVAEVRRNGGGLAVKPHSSVRPTSCPGDDWRRHAARFDGKPTGTVPPPLPPGVEEENDVLKRGDKGGQVAYLQRRINDALDRDAIAEDGDFGPATEAAVREIQAGVGFEQTGVADMMTAIYIQALAHGKQTPHGGGGLSQSDADRRYVRQGVSVKIT